MKVAKAADEIGECGIAEPGLMFGSRHFRIHRDIWIAGALANKAQQAFARVGVMRQHHVRHHVGTGVDERIARDTRSEEHTSELQSLMRISYAVFCLKKKKKQASLELKKPWKYT